MPIPLFLTLYCLPLKGRKCPKRSGSYFTNGTDLWWMIMASYVRRLQQGINWFFLGNTGSWCIKHCMYNMGHLGLERVTQLARQRFYWPGMEGDITRFITSSCSCLKDKKRARQIRSTYMTSITSTQPLELVFIDFLHLEKSKGWLRVHPRRHGSLHKAGPGISHQR